MGKGRLRVMDPPRSSAFGKGSGDRKGLAHWFSNGSGIRGSEHNPGSSCETLGKCLCAVLPSALMREQQSKRSPAVEGWPGRILKHLVNTAGRRCSPDGWLESQEGAAESQASLALWQTFDFHKKTPSKNL